MSLRPARAAETVSVRKEEEYACMDGNAYRATCKIAEIVRHLPCKPGFDPWNPHKSGSRGKLSSDLYTCTFYFKGHIYLCLLAHNFNSSTWEAEADEYLSFRPALSTEQVPSQPELEREPVSNWEGGLYIESVFLVSIET